MRRFQPEQPAADHHRIATRRGRAQHRTDIIHITECHDTVQVVPGNRDDKGIGSSRKQQLVVCLDTARPRGDGTPGTVDRNDWIARDQIDRIVGVPGVIVDHDVLERFVPREQR